MSKAVKTIVSIAAAVAIPFVAPAIASSIGLSAAIGATAGSALVGAGLGAASAAITDQNVGRGALLGGIGGGIGGYMQAPAAPAGGVAGGTGITPGLVEPATAGSQYALTGTGAGGLSLSAAAPAVAAETSPYALTAGLSTPTSSAAFGAGSQLAATGAGGAGLSFPATPTMAATSPYAVTAGLGAGAAGAAAPSAAATTYTQALANRLTSPEGLADMTLRAAGLLAGSAIAGDGLSSEERALLTEQVNELRQLQQTNRALFDQRLEQAQNLIGESRYFDPEYFGLQRARRVQVAAAKMKRGGLRGLEGEAREAEGRRFDIAAAREAGTAFDQGYLTGLQGRIQTQQAGLQAMPTGFPSSAAAYSNLRSAYSGAAERTRQAQADVGELFGTLTGSYRAQQRGRL
jgi:hypothetical protein